ncbi:hypothetical protein IQ266_08520 [filamentous cyanobacterium LEGE 11480]|uniref:Uncharacterized protein n=1 Tax=Romeriopsis navalis LEGE 11480 TaxID=2777977 RepID=A0A928VPM9_9CYAN|nr:hypothetical protein [Romeriopsis navalis]MBE9029769.1 hypothetical protein [Romeriopsis navalis LEGE 11480]
MFRQIASIAAVAMTVGAPMLPLTNNVALAGQQQQKTQLAARKQNSCVQVRLDRYDYRGEAKKRVRRRVRVNIGGKKRIVIKKGYRHFDKMYFDWHVDCYNQNNPPYRVTVTSYYGKRRYTAKYRGTASEYVFKTRKPRRYWGRKPDFVKIKISVVGNKGRYHYRSGKIQF